MDVSIASSSFPRGILRTLDPPHQPLCTVRVPRAVSLC
jgi:hypothetical protein